MARRIALAAVALAASMAGCGEEKGVAGAERTARVVMSVPKTGPGAALGRDMVDAAKLELSRRGGRAGGAQVVLKVVPESSADGSRVEPEEIARQAAAAVADEDTIGWLGGFDSNTTALALPLLNAGGVTVVSPLAPATPLTNRDPDFPGAPAKYYPRADVYGRSFVRLAADDTRVARLAMRSLRDRGVRSIYSIDAGDTDGVAFSSAVQRSAPQAGVRFAGRQSVVPGQADWQAVIADAGASGADAISWGSAAGLGEGDLWRAAAVVRARQLMVAGPAVPQEALESLAAVKGGTIAYSGLAPWGDQGLSTGFVEAFRKRTGRAPLPGSANAAAAMDLMLDSIAEGSRTAGPSLTGDDLRSATAKALHSVEELRTPFGVVRLTPAGDPANAPVIEWRWDRTGLRPVARLG